MRKISLAVLLFLLFSLGTGILAQDSELPEPGLTPDSPFYFLETIAEEIVTFFNFGDLKKAARYAALAAERVAEAQALIQEGKPEFAEKAFQRYEMQLNKSIARAEKAQAKGKSVKKVMEVIAEGTGKHLEVIEGILEKTSGKAKEAATKAKEVSMAGQKNALRSLAEEDPEEATEINLKAAENRLHKAEIEIEQGDLEEMEEAIEEFESQHKFGEEISQIAQDLGKDITTVEQLVGKATSIHLEILADVYEKVPDQAKPSVESAMKASVKGHERAVEALKEKNALGGVPEEVSLPAHVPQEVQERVQTKASQELEVEKVLDSFGSFESIRNLCIEQGGPSEMCNQIPLEGFDSFEALETFCLGQGATSEICASLETRCGELGVTDVDECFIILSTHSLKAYQETDLKISPQSGH